MHARELADLAALVCIYSRAIATASPRHVDESLAEYWTSSRCRLDGWCRGLRRLTRTAEQQPHCDWSPGATQLVEEVCVSEILVRTFGAVLAAHDRHHGRTEAEPVGRNVLAGQLDARRRAVRLLQSPAHEGTRHAEQINSLQRRCDRWNDLLLAYLMPCDEVAAYAVDPARVQDFSFDVRCHLATEKSCRSTLAMLSAGLQTSFAPLTDGAAPSAELNRQLAASVLGCFGPEFFDSFGLLRSVWLERLGATSDETLALLDQWWEPAAMAAASTARRRF